jgi:hypothetical protein
MSLARKLEPETQVESMTEKEARTCVTKIRSGIDGVREHVLSLHERKGWESLGYKSWRKCVVAEFPRGQAHLYNELAAARVERNFQHVGKELPAPLTFRVANTLARLKEPEKQVLAWTEAVELAEDGTPGAKLVAEVVTKYLPEKKTRESKAKPKPSSEITKDDLAKAREALAELEARGRWACPECDTSYPKSITVCGHCADPEVEADEETGFVPFVESAKVDRFVTEILEAWPDDVSLSELEQTLESVLETVRRIEERKRNA